MDDTPADTASHIEQATSTKRRYATASRILDDPRCMAKYHHLVEATRMAEDPLAQCAAGERLLRSAPRVGLLAGSFNPMTLAHIALARAARRELQLDAVVWTCAVVTVDKERVSRATVEDRIAQLAAFSRRRACAVVVVNRGLYVAQARALRALAAPGARLVILIGFDKLVQIFDPRYYADRDAALHELFALADLAVAPRAGFGPDAMDALLARRENRPFAPHISTLRMEPTYTATSATEVRQRARDAAVADTQLARLVPPEALALIDSTGAYRDPPSDDDFDVYGWRASLIRVLSMAPPRLLRQTPPISLLLHRLRLRFATDALPRGATDFGADVFGARLTPSLLEELAAPL